VDNVKQELLKGNILVILNIANLILAISQKMADCHANEAAEALLGLAHQAFDVALRAQGEERLKFALRSLS
jgi:hypothetical protein